MKRKMTEKDRNLLTDKLPIFQFGNWLAYASMAVITIFLMNNAELDFMISFGIALAVTLIWRSYYTQHCIYESKISQEQSMRLIVYSGIVGAITSYLVDYIGVQEQMVAQETAIVIFVVLMLAVNGKLQRKFVFKK